MKNLNIKEMESISGSTNGRNCFLMGVAVVASIGLGPIAAIGWGTAASMSAGFFGGASLSDCF